jgi:GAF domain-containing protein
MDGHYLVLAPFNIGLNVLIGGYILLLAPRRRANQLFAAILILPQLPTLLTLIGSSLASLPVARAAAYLELLAQAFAMAAMLHFALIYPKHTRLPQRVFYNGLLFGLLAFDLITIYFVGSSGGIRGILMGLLVPWAIYLLSVALLRPHDLPASRVLRIVVVGALVSLLLSALVGPIEGYRWWGEINLAVNLLTAAGVVIYLRHLSHGHETFLNPARWAEWGRWQIPVIYTSLLAFTLIVVFLTSPTLVQLQDFVYTVQLSEAANTWLGIVQTTAIALLLLVLRENYRRIPAGNPGQRQQLRVLLLGFGIYYILGLGSTILEMQAQAAGWYLYLRVVWSVLLPLTLTVTVGLSIVRYRFLDATLNTVASLVSSSLELDTILGIILEQARGLLDCSSSGLLLVEGDRLRLRAHTDPASVWRSFSIEEQPALKRVLLTKQPVLVSDVQRASEAFHVAQREAMPRSWLGTPLLAHEQAIGLIYASHYEPYRYNRDDVATLATFAYQVAVAIDNARLYDSQRRRAATLAQAQQLSTAISSSLQLEQVLKMAMEELSRLFNVDHCGLVLFDKSQERGRVVAEYPDTGAMDLELTLDYPAVREVIDMQHPVAVDDLEHDERMGSSRAPLIKLGIQSILLAPLVVQGKVIGSIGLDAIKRRRNWAPEELDLCRIVSAQIAAAVANAQAYEQEQQARQLADTLREVSNVVGSTLDLDEVLVRILDELHRVLPYEGATVWWRRADHLYARARRALGHDTEEESAHSLPLDRFATLNQVIEAGEVMVISDTQNDPRWTQLEGESTRSWIGMPLMAKGHVAGMLSIKSYTPNMYSEVDLSLLKAFATQVAVAVENARLYEIEITQIEQELEIARRTQMSLLPASAPDVPSFEVAGYSLPAREVGGDFFQYYPLSEGKLGVAVGDVSGKGMPAALMMAVTTGTLDAVMLAASAPRELLAQINQVLTPHGRRSHLNSACCIAIFDRQNQRVATANAGFVAPLLLREGQCALVDIGGMPLGMIEDAAYEERQLGIQAGDLFVFCSDGIVEAMNSSQEMYGFERLLARVAAVASQGQPFSAPLVIEWILQDVRAFVGEAEQHDDMTIVTIGVK